MALALKAADKAGYAAVAVLQLGILAIIIATFTHPDWVTQGSGDNEWTGSLRSCNSCNGRFDDKTYSQLADEECGLAASSSTCALFSNLYHAYEAFLVLELLTLALLVVWMFRVLLHFLGKLLFHDCYVFLLPLLMTLLQMIGFLVWAAIARSGFHEDCGQWDITYYSTQRGPLCHEEGPNLAFANGLIMVGSTVIYYFVYMNQYKSNPYVDQGLEPAGATAEGDDEPE